MRLIQNQGGVIQTYTGKLVNPDKLRESDIDLLDIAQSLSLQCRYWGHTSFHYSIAQHSIYVAQLVPRGLAFLALMHDAAEAYTSDIVKPRKTEDDDDREARVWEVIAKKFGLPKELPGEVKAADQAMLVAEREQIMAPGPEWAGLQGIRPARIRIYQWSPQQARHEFLFWAEASSSRSQ